MRRSDQKFVVGDGLHGFVELPHVAEGSIAVVGSGIGVVSLGETLLLVKKIVAESVAAAVVGKIAAVVDLDEFAVDLAEIAVDLAVVVVVAAIAAAAVVV